MKLEKGSTVVKGITTTLPKLRSIGRKGWRSLCPQPAFFIMGKEKGKLGYFWKHAFTVAKSGRELGGLINPDTGHAVAAADGGFLSRMDLREAKYSETFQAGKQGTSRFSPLWQADREKIQRMAPLDFIGRYMKGWWDYAIADELHQLAGDTAQGNGLGVLARSADKLIALTGTLMGGYPDHPYGIGAIWGKQYDPQQGCMVPFFVTEPEDLPETDTYAKEQRLIGDIREELRQGRRCQVYATFTGKHDVTARLERVLQQAGFRVAVLRSTVATDKREAWYERQLRAGVEVVICHPRLVETGLDLLAFPTLYFYETGYSLHTLRQASRRSWRIGQKHPVRVKFLAYSGTMQETCIRHMGKKMLVALMMEGKFSGEGLQSLDANEDLLTAMARELVEKGGVGESADAVWKDLERERARHAPEQSTSPELMEAVAVAVGQAIAPVEIPADAAVTPGLQLVHSNQLRPKRKQAPLWPTGHLAGEQMRLFG